MNIAFVSSKEKEMLQMGTLKMAEAAPVSRSGFEYSFYAWQMSCPQNALRWRKCQVGQARAVVGI